MEPYLKPEDKKLFLNYLRKSTCYFEYGSGGSTYVASKEPNVKSVHAVESDGMWQRNVREKCDFSNKTFVEWIDLKCEPKNWGYPGSDCTFDQKRSYSNAITRYPFAGKVDLLFIDGRFRVACALKAFEVLSDDAVVIIDDFLDRPYYHEVLKFYEIIDKTSDNSLVVLKKKKNIQPPSLQLVTHFELDSK